MFLGVASLLFRSPGSAIMTDGFFSRPGRRAVLSSVLARRLCPREDAISRGLDRAGVSSLDSVLPIHTHHDHALDSAVVAKLTGATVVGGKSAANIARGGGLPEAQISVVGHGDVTMFGGFRVRHVPSKHSCPDLVPGTIEKPLRPPARLWAYKCGEAWSMLIQHGSPPDRRTALVHGSAGYVPGALRGRRADVVYLGVGQLGRRRPAHIERYWMETVRAVQPHRVVLIHWDDFFRPSSQDLLPTRYLIDNLDKAIDVLRRLAEQDGVSLNLPSIWVREDPWRRD
jgi:L-ascorbate metabolism protein UlaG (beta-lactamase superfamily)